MQQAFQQMLLCRTRPQIFAQPAARLVAVCSSSSGKPAQLHSQERTISVQDVLMDARELGGDSLVFEELHESAEEWERHQAQQAQQRQGAEPPQPEPTVKGALDPSVMEILSAYSPEQGFQECSVDDLQQRLQSPATASSTAVLDVRTNWEIIRGGLIPGAIHIPLDELSAAVREGRLDAAREQQIAVICAAGIRSAQAAVRLSRVFKFPSVVNVAGGMNEWSQKGYPVHQ